MTPGLTSFAARLPVVRTRAVRSRELRSFGHGEDYDWQR